MLTITASAWKRLIQIQTSRPNVMAIRLKYGDGTFKCCSGKRGTGDCVIENDDSPTLLMTPAVAQDLADRTLDAIDTQGGSRLRLQPEITATAKQERLK